MDKMKKYFKAAYAAMLSIVVLCLAGCTKNFDELNTPKNLITVKNINLSTLGQAFADAQYYGHVGDQGGWELMHELHASIYAQVYTTTSSGFNTDQYQTVASWVQSGFNAFYSNPAVMINFVKNYTAENNMPAENAVAQIWEVPIWQRMTDFFGPVMFSQFGNGKTSVEYDSQEDLYRSFFKILDDATATLKQHTGETPFGNNDLMFGGNVNKWITFANSLRLRLAIRIVYADPELARQEAEKAVAAGVMTDHTQTANVSTTASSLNYLTRWTYINPFCMSATTESILVGFNDPRLTVFWNEGGGRLGGNKGFHGVRNGLPVVLKTSDLRSGVAGCSFPSKKFLPIADGGANPPIPIITAAEAFFLRAEGALRGWNMGGAAKDLYNEGIRQSLKYWANSPDADINDYIASNNTPSAVPDGIVGQDFHTPPQSDITVKYEEGAPFERNLEQIITQKWIDLFMSPWECWAERRRTGYPRGYAIIASLDPDIPVTAIIRRMVFPPSEYSNNKVAVEKAVTLLGGPDNTMTRVWWDKKPLSDYPDLSATIVP